MAITSSIIVKVSQCFGAELMSDNIVYNYILKICNGYLLLCKNRLKQLRGIAENEY